MSLLLFLVTLFIIETQAFIPRVCHHNVTKKPAVCCPVPPGRREPCGGFGWGACRLIFVTRDSHRASSLTRNDDRLDWPTRIFTHGCHCTSRRFGFGCQRCRFGWTGVNCSTRQVLIRRNVLKYSAQEQHDLQRVLLLGREVPSDYVIIEERFNNLSDPLRNPIFLNASLHQVLVFNHRYASRTTLLKDRENCKHLVNEDMNHKGPGFITWHRYFILVWEQELREAATRHLGPQFVNFTFPYWDWTDATRCEVCSASFVGNLSQHLRPQDRGPFGKWLEFCPKRPELMGTCASCHWNKTHGRRTEKTITRDWNHALNSGSSSGRIFPSKNDIRFVFSRDIFITDDEVDYVKFVSLWRQQKDLTCHSFSLAIEGHCSRYDRHHLMMHNLVHGSTIGSFKNTASSPNDPFFVLHHTQMDRIFERWLRHHPSSILDLPISSMAKPGHCGTCNMVGFFPPLSHLHMFQNSRFIGYDYDSFQFNAP